MASWGVHRDDVRGNFTGRARQSKAADFEARLRAQRAARVESEPRDHSGYQTRVTLQGPPDVRTKLRSKGITPRNFANDQKVLLKRMARANGIIKEALVEQKRSETAHSKLKKFQRVDSRHKLVAERDAKVKAKQQSRPATARSSRSSVRTPASVTTSVASSRPSTAGKWSMRSSRAPSSTSSTRSSTYSCSTCSRSTCYSTSTRRTRTSSTASSLCSCCDHNSTRDSLMLEDFDDENSLPEHYNVPAGRPTSKPGTVADALKPKINGAPEAVPAKPSQQSAPVAGRPTNRGTSMAEAIKQAGAAPAGRSSAQPRPPLKIPGYSGFVPGAAVEQEHVGQTWGRINRKKR